MRKISLKAPSRRQVGIGLLAFLVALILFAVGLQTGEQYTGPNLAGLESHNIGDAIGKGVTPTFEKVINSSNETRGKVKDLSQKQVDFDTRFKQAFDDLNRQMEELKQRRINNDEVIKGIQDQLKNLPSIVPISRLNELTKEVAQLNANFRLGATA